MATRIVVNHDDPAFVEALADTLRANGCDVVTGTDPPATVGPPQVASALEISVSQSKGRHRGIRIGVTKLPMHGQYAGMLGHFLGEPVTVADVVEALARFRV
jgi:hypothetical protein